jgi:hypothetical protein
MNIVTVILSVELYVICVILESFKNVTSDEIVRICLSLGIWTELGEPGCGHNKKRGEDK